MLYDTITNYGITIKNNDIYLVKNGQEIKLVDIEKELNKTFSRCDNLSARCD
jgi:hypothetical protein